ncbi:hypothetical protein ECAE60S_00319 [Eoetvoesiella caeni]
MAAEKYTATRLAAPRGGAFCLGAARRQNIPPRCAATRLAAPPEGALFALGRPDGKIYPHAAPLRGLLPPRGCFLPWGGPAAKYTPTPHRYAACCPPRGRFLPWGGPAAKRGRDTPPLPCLCRNYLADTSATVVSSMRLEKPHSLSYHEQTLTRLPETLVMPASTVLDTAVWL